MSGDGSGQNFLDSGGDFNGDAGSAVLGGGLCDLEPLHRAVTIEHSSDDECGA